MPEDDQTRTRVESATADPKNSLFTLMGGWVTFNMDGIFMSGPVYVDPQGFVRVRMPTVHRLDPEPEEST